MVSVSCRIAHDRDLTHGLARPWPGHGQWGGAGNPGDLGTHETGNSGTLDKPIGHCHGLACCCLSALVVGCVRVWSLPSRSILHPRVEVVLSFMCVLEFWYLAARRSVATPVALCM